MEEIKKMVAELIVEALDNKVEVQEVFDKIEVPKDNKNGDFAYPCFNLAKVLRNSPVNIANQIKKDIKESSKISKVEVVNGYLNFYTNSEDIVGTVLKNILSKGDSYGESTFGNNKNVVIDYSSPNIAKPMHIGHLRNTILGSSLYKIYTAMGYNVIGINYIGDWGINFAKIMAGYSMWKDEYTFTEDSLDPIVKIYVRYNELEKEDSKYTDIARKWHIKLEEGDKEALDLWNWLKGISLKEAGKVYSILNCKFDSYNGESFYNDKMDSIIEELEEKNLLETSQGAKVVDLSDYNMPPCIILTSSGTTLYATRDLASLKYRIENYNFDKALYVVGSEQQLHFKQVFKTFELMGYEKYTKNCKHIYYGLVLDAEGKKMGTRKGNSITLLDLLNEGIEKASSVLEEKSSDIEDKKTLAKQVGIGAIIFNTLYNGKTKDVMFDWNSILNFTGETGPYVQYTYVRTKSILEKIGFDVESLDINKMNMNILEQDQEIELIKLLDKLPEIIKKAADEYEPSVVSRYVMEVSAKFSKFYNDCPVANCKDEELKIARGILVYSTGMVIKKGLELLGIDCPDKM